MAPLESGDCRHSNGTGRISLRGREGVARFAAAAVLLSSGVGVVFVVEKAPSMDQSKFEMCKEAFWEDFDQWDGSGYDSGPMLSRSLL